MFLLSASSVLGGLVFVFLFQLFRRTKNLPPGPWSLPIIGHRFKSGLIHETYNDLAKKYGPIFSVRRGPFRVVVLNDGKTIKQAFLKSAEFFNDRFVPGQMKWGVLDVTKNASLVWSNGKVWEEQRKFSLHALRAFGFGKKSLVPQINLEARYLAEEIRKCKGEPTDLSSALSKATANVICQLVFGRRYEYDDPEFKEVLKSIMLIFSDIPSTDPIFVFGWLLYTPWYKRFRDETVKLKDYIMKQLYMHRDTFREDHIRDFVDAFLADDISKDKPLEELWRVAIDLFGAGTETTALSTSWVIVYLAVHPDVQAKVHTELDAVVGRGRQPTTDDRPNLPYCEATLMEVMRIRPVFPVTARMTTSSVSLGGFTIPKGTIIIGNLWASHHDSTVWEDPDTFKPERFLSDDGQTVLKNEAWLPFGIGRRKCLGSQLAKMETFLLFTNLFQQFEFKLPSDRPTHSLKGMPGLSMPPQAYQICAIER